MRERNYRCPYGEIDLVAVNEEYVVFVEVKTRAAGAPLHPSLSVNGRKQAKVRQLGEYYCARHPELTLQPRFDVVAVELGRWRRKVDHVINAF